VQSLTSFRSTMQQAFQDWIARRAGPNGDEDDYLFPLQAVIPATPQGADERPWYEVHLASGGVRVRTNTWPRPLGGQWWLGGQVPRREGQRLAFLASSNGKGSPGRRHSARRWAWALSGWSGK
jgi:hypothetical protein